MGVAISSPPIAVPSSSAKVIAGKGATNYAVGLAVARIVESIRRDENRVLPISTLLQDWHGITDVCMSVPTLVNARGAGQRPAAPRRPGTLVEGAAHLAGFLIDGDVQVGIGVLQDTVTRNGKVSPR